VPTYPVPNVLPAFYDVLVDEEVNDGVENEVDDARMTTLDFDTNFGDGWSQPQYLLVFAKAICSEGFAQHNIYALVEMLHTKWPPMNIIAFNDAAPSGWDIMQKFYYMSTVGHRFSVPIKMGGLLISDIIHDDKIVPLRRKWTVGTSRAFVVLVSILGLRIVLKPMRHINTSN
jgi:hypothetical protein